MLQTKYVSVDEFRDYFVDIDLRAELGTDESALAFLKRIEDRMESFIDANFHRQVEREYPVFTDYQKKHYKRALLEQAIYVFRNGDLSVDSGYDKERGVVADINQIRRVAIAPNTKQELMLCGLWSRHINGSHNALWWLF